MQEESLRNKRVKKTSVTRYASSVLKESSVTAVSGIISTSSLPRRVFRVVVFLIITIGFLYQCIKFLTFYFEYPTTVEISILRPEQYMTPALTFCNNQRIKRSKYCNKYPDQCITPSKEYCKMHEKYCGEGETKIPKEEYMTQKFSHDDVYELGHELYDVLVLKDGELFGYRNNVSINQVHRIRDHRFGEISLCYTFNSLVDSPEEPLYTDTHSFSLSDRISYHLVFNPEKSDMFDDELRPGIYFSIHSPFDAVNPFEKGFFMEPGGHYKFTVYMEEETLLESPYKTDCMNYTKIWLNNNRAGPRSQKMCQEKCINDILLSCLNCTVPVLKYSSEERPSFCNTDADFFMKNLLKCYGSEEQFDLTMLECIKSCKEECHKWKYYPEMRKMYLSPRASNSSRFIDLDMIYVDITMEDMEIISYKYRPQYQQIEAFSYIGGFIGMWLGISLVQVTEFFESVFLIGRYFLKKHQMSRENNT